MGRNKAKPKPVRPTRDVWSATSSANEALVLRDEAIDRLPGNKYLDEVSEAEYRILYRQIVDSLTTQNMRDSRLFASRFLGHPDINPERDPYGFQKMAIAQTKRDVKDLVDGEIYITSPGMHATTMAAAATLGDEDILGLDEKDLPSETGFLVLPEIQMVRRAGAPVPDEIRAFSWHKGVRIEPNPFGGYTTYSALKVTAWFDRTGPIQAAEFSQRMKEAKADGFPYPRLLPVQHADCPLGASGKLSLGEPTNLGMRLPMTNKDVSGFSPEDVPEVDLASWSLKYVMAFMRLTHQKVAVPSTARRPGRGTGGRMDIERVRVIQLRSYSKDDGPGSIPGTIRGYSHRWIVKMHKVNQWYPSEGVHRIIWRGPYVKGPDNTPILNNDKVNALVR